MTDSMRRQLRLAIAAVCAASVAEAAVTVAPGFKLRHIPTPGVVQGGVLRSGNAIFVGQGTYGAGGESIVRLDGTIATTVADGFGSLGGLDIDGAGTLYAVDNCYVGDFGCSTATTGDTLYGIPTAVSRTTTAAAGTVEVLPAGSIPFASDPLVVPGAVLVSDSTGPGAGRIVKVVGNTSSNLVTGLDYTAGLALQGGTTVLVGNSNFPTPGTIQKFTLAGGAGGALATGLSGVYALAIENAGNVLATGGSANDFSSTVVAIDSLGVVTERARGFSFTGDLFYDPARDAALVLDFGVSEIASICGDVNADGTCDADCAAPVAYDAVKLKLGGLTTAPGDDTLGLSGIAALGVALDPVIDGLRLWIDAADAKVVADVVVPGGLYDPITHVGWKPNGAGTSWKYRNAAGTGGVTSVSVKKLGITGDVKFKVTGKHAGFATDGAALPLTAGIAVGAGHCASAPLACTPSGTKRLKCG